MSRLIVIASMLIFLCVYVNAADLAVSDRQGDVGDLVTFTVTAKNAPTSVKAFSFFVEYNPLILKYHSYQPSNLTQNSSIFYVNNSSMGEVKVLGVDPADLFKKGDSGEIVNLVFEVVGSGDSDVVFTAIKDDIKTWHTQDAKFTGKKNQNQEEGENIDDNSDSESNSNSASDGNSLNSEKEGIDIVRRTEPSLYEQLPNYLTTSTGAIEKKGKHSGVTQTVSNSNLSESGNQSEQGHFDFSTVKTDSIETDKSRTKQGITLSLKPENKNRMKESSGNSCFNGKAIIAFLVVIFVQFALILCLQIIILHKLNLLNKKIN